MADQVYTTQPMPLSSSNGTAMPADSPENLKANAVNSEVRQIAASPVLHNSLLTVPQ